MKTVNLENEIKDNYKAHRLTDEHDLSAFQFNYYDMIDFAKSISDKTIELCAERIKDVQYDDNEIRNHIHDVIVRIKLTKNQII